MNANEFLQALLGFRETVDPPFEVDEEAKARYVAVVEELQGLQAKGYLEFTATDVDSLESEHDIIITWKDEVCSLSPRETKILRDCLSLDGEACIAEEGKVWVVGITIYSHKAK